LVLFALNHPVTLTKKESHVKKQRVLVSTVAQATASCALYKKQGRNIKSQEDISKHRKKLIEAQFAHSSTVAVDILPPYEAFLHLHRGDWRKPKIVAYLLSVVANQDVGYEMLGNVAAIRGGVMRPTEAQPTTLKEMIIQYWDSNAIPMDVILAYVQQPEHDTREDAGDGEGGEAAE
jgi:hypothetical protein